MTSNEFADGGGGTDTLVGTGIVQGTHYNLATGQMISGATIQLIAGFEFVTGSVANESFTGTVDNNLFYGGGGNDTMDGGAGFDTLVGGEGNDTMIVRNSATSVEEGVGQGIADVVLAAVSFALVTGPRWSGCRPRPLPAPRRST